MYLLDVHQVYLILGPQRVCRNKKNPCYKQYNVDTTHKKIKN